MGKESADNAINPEPADDGEEDARFHLKPELFPRRLELELSPEVLQALQELSARSGRSIGEIAEEIISRRMTPPAEDQDAH